MTPVPYDFSVTVSFWSKKVSMLLDMVEQVIPSYRQMRSYPLIEFKFSDGSQIQRDIPVILNTTDITIGNEWQSDEVQLFEASLSFTCKGWIYPSIFKADTTSGGNAGGTIIGERSDGLYYIEHINVEYDNWVGTTFERMEDISIDFETGNMPVITIYSYPGTL
jgi:hypothetical protein